MHRFIPLLLLFLAAFTACQAIPASTPIPSPAPQPTEFVSAPPPNATLVADGLLSPRGFTFGSDGSIYIAEAGTSPPANQNTVNTGRISRIAPDGTRTTVIKELATTSTEFNGALGASSLAFIGDTLYLAMAGPDGGRGNVKSGIYRVNQDGSTLLIADLGQYNEDHMPQNIDSDWDRANPYDVVAFNNKLYIADGNVQTVTEVDPTAAEGSRIRRVADMSRGHPVLTGIVAGADGNLYVSQFGHGPYTEAFSKGTSEIFQVTLDGKVTPIASGITLGSGLAQAPDGTFYVAEFGQTPDKSSNVTEPGRIVKLKAGDTNAQEFLPSVAFPTIIRWGSDGYLYFTVYSVILPAGAQPRGALYKIQP